MAAPMQYGRLGYTGLQVSRVGFGGWLNWTESAGEGRVHEMLDAAFVAGVNFFDTAEAYGRGQAETILGNWVASRKHKVSSPMPRPCASLAIQAHNSHP